MSTPRTAASRRLARSAPRDGGSLGATAYRRLQEAIRDGALAPGTRLREEDLAATLRMSRTPVREALRQLQSEGLVSQDAQRGMAVSRLDHQMMTELYLMRDVLEGAAARLAARHASEAEVAVLRDLVAVEARLGRDPQVLARHNQRFHEALYLAAHNRYLLRTLNALRDAMALLGETTYAARGRAETALAEHRAIVEAISAGDAAAAETAARAHIQGAQRTRIRMLAEAKPPVTENLNGERK
ncbi:MAG TPA: GntR family transcriptional regulator [Burkholderiales bacterium]|nr:GntR family transcriptional regulator [Burkholderiales bacterium]